MASPPTGLPARSPGPRCTVCNHPDRDRIDALLTAGQRTYASLQSEFQIDDSVLQQHAAKHLPARLLKSQSDLEEEKNRQFAHLTIAQSASRLSDLQELLDGLKTIRARRAAKATEEAPGSETGLLIVRKRSIRTGDGNFEQITESEVDTALIAEVRALHRAAAIETGEYLAQTGKGSFGAGGVNGPLVVVLSSGLQPIPGEEPATARHRIGNSARRAVRNALETEGDGQRAASLSLTDVTFSAQVDEESTREGTLSGLPEE
jgi:hypothetical protein